MSDTFQSYIAKVSPECRRSVALKPACMRHKPQLRHFDTFKPQLVAHRGKEEGVCKAINEKKVSFSVWLPFKSGHVGQKQRFQDDTFREKEVSKDDTFQVPGWISYDIGLSPLLGRQNLCRPHKMFAFP